MLRNFGRTAGMTTQNFQLFTCTWCPYSPFLAPTEAAPPARVRARNPRPPLIGLLWRRPVLGLTTIVLCIRLRLYC